MCFYESNAYTYFFYSGMGLFNIHNLNLLKAFYIIHNIKYEIVCFIRYKHIR